MAQPVLWMLVLVENVAHKVQRPRRRINHKNERQNPLSDINPHTKTDSRSARLFGNGCGSLLAQRDKGQNRVRVEIRRVVSLQRRQSLAVIPDVIVQLLRLRGILRPAKSLLIIFGGLLDGLNLLPPVFNENTAPRLRVEIVGGNPFLRTAGASRSAAWRGVDWLGLLQPLHIRRDPSSIFCRSNLGRLRPSVIRGDEDQNQGRQSVVDRKSTRLNSSHRC